MKTNIHKINFAEMLNDSKGRTSPSKFLGLVGGTVSILVFLLCGISILTKYQDGLNVQSIAMQSVAMLTVCATLLGIRRFTKDKDIVQQEQDTLINP
jgi:hypothetical protein